MSRTAYTLAEVDEQLRDAAEALALAPPSQRTAAVTRCDRWLDRRLRLTTPAPEPEVAHA